jgi:HK97 family phage major capsid protein
MSDFGLIESSKIPSGEGMDALRAGAQRRAHELVNEASVLMNTLNHDPRQKSFIGLSSAEVREYSVLRAIGEISQMARVKRGWNITGVEGEAHRELVKTHGELSTPAGFYVPIEIQTRDLGAASLPGGGALVGTSAGGSYVEALRNTSVAYRLGAQRLPGQRENLAIPRQSGAASGGWLSTESSQGAESQPTFGQLAGTPKTLAGYTEISDRLTRQSNPAAEGLVMADLAMVAALVLDSAVISGSGAAGQPIGILNTAGIGAFTGATLGYTALVDAQTDVLAANAILNPLTLGYATTPTVAQLLKGRQRFTGVDTPVWQGAVHAGEIEGVRSLASLQIPAATMIYGDWSQVLVPEWGVLAIEINPFANFQAGIIGIRVLWSVDVIVRHPESFSVATSIN